MTVIKQECQCFFLILQSCHYSFVHNYLKLYKIVQLLVPLSYLYQCGAVSIHLICGTDFIHNCGTLNIGKVDTQNQFCQFSNTTCRFATPIVMAKDVSISIGWVHYTLNLQVQTGMVCLLCLWFVGFGNYILKAAACSAVSMVIVMYLKLSLLCSVTVCVTNYTAVFTVFHTTVHVPRHCT